MTTRTIQVYKSYSFVNKDPAIDKVRTLIKDTGLSYEEIHEKSGVSVATLRGWFDGKTRKPQNPTIEAVGRACGYHREWVRTVPKKKRK